MMHRVKHANGFIDEADPVKADALAIALNGTVETLPPPAEELPSLDEAWNAGALYVKTFFTTDQLVTLLKIVSAGDPDTSMPAAVVQWLNWARTKVGAAPVLTRWGKAAEVKLWIDNMESAAVQSVKDKEPFNPADFGEPPFTFSQIMEVP